MTHRDNQPDAAYQASLENLAQEASPGHNLWPAIESQLYSRETNTYNRRWMPIALAISVMVSSLAVWFGWNQMERSKQLVAESQQALREAEKVRIQAQIDRMANEYSLAKSALLAQIGANAGAVHVDLLKDVKANLLIIEQATSELKAALEKNPDNQGLYKLLNHTYQQELAVLTQLARLQQES